jgi:molecular chaperone GrpE
LSGFINRVLGEGRTLNRDHLTEDEELVEEVPNEASAEAEEVVVEAEAPLSPEEQLADTQAKADEYLDGWQRARAELTNYKRRVDRERAEIHATARIPVLARFLDVLDDLERALENAPESLDGDGWFEGLMLVQRKFSSLLEAEGVTEIETAGQMFDPALHEAIAQESSEDHQEGEIIGAVQKGYRLGDHVVRPARVRVAG